MTLQQCQPTLRKCKLYLKPKMRGKNIWIKNRNIDISIIHEIYVISVKIFTEINTDI